MGGTSRISTMRTCKLTRMAAEKFRRVSLLTL